MTSLKLKALTLYKHGVGFFQRAGEVDGSVALLFKREAMNDILKSLTVSTDSAGRLVGMEFDTPTDEDDISAGRQIDLSDGRALRDLLHQLKGHSVELHLTGKKTATGVVVGLDERGQAKLGQTLIALYQPNEGDVKRYSLKQLEGFSINDPTVRGDLAHFLNKHAQDDSYSTIRLRFSPETTETAVAYVAPAPTWRISYRLVGSMKENEPAGTALFQGWAIFDNTLDEALEDVYLSLVAGMPISFTYGLYHPSTPQRPHFADSKRTIDSEITFDSAAPLAKPAAAATPFQMARQRAMMAEAPPADLQESIEPDTRADSLGELFAYRINQPVSVGRGRSAMVPIFQTELAIDKKLIYNATKYQAHPIAVFEAQNATNGPLERGPVTVIENDSYLGDAVINFTAAGDKLLIPYAVELGVLITQERQPSQKKEKISLRDAFLIVEEWHFWTTTYEIHNKLSEIAHLIIEHPRETHYNLETTPSLIEETNEYSRLAVEVSAQTRKKFQVVARRLVTRKQALNKLSWRDAQTAFQGNLLDERSRIRLRALLDILEPLEKREGELTQNLTQQAQIRETQSQIQGHLASLGSEGKEGELRLRYVRSLEEKEDQLDQLNDLAGKLSERITTLKNLLASQLQSWVEKNDQPRTKGER